MLMKTRWLRQLALALTCALAGCAVDTEALDMQPSEDELAGMEQELRLATPIPAELAVPEGTRFYFKLHARGTQVYTCKQTAESTFAWTFVEPEARLYGLFLPVGHHYAGPTWELFDGSSVVGSRVAGVSVDSTAIPWLLLKASAHSERGILSKVSFIQRIDTVGGNAPGVGCDAEHLAAGVEVPYTATYAFYR